MADWPADTCGNCGFSPGVTLKKYVCPKCSTEMCNKCSGGNDDSPACMNCTAKMFGIGRPPQRAV